MQQNKVVIYAVAAALAVLALGFIGFKLLGSDGDPVAQASANNADTAVTAQDVLAASGPLGDMEMGAKDAPVTVIEYASLTCSHCAEFDSKTLPLLKSNYIDTGKVRYILREFPYDEFATSAFMLSRCAGQERYFGFVDTLFKKQAEWAFTENPIQGLLAIAKQGGFSEGSFDACMNNQQIFQHISQVATKAKNDFKVQSTPSFFVNGEMVVGALAYEDFEKIVKKHLPSEQQ